MKKSVMRVILQFFFLHYVVSQVLPSAYLPYDLVQWSTRIDYLLKTGSLKGPKFDIGNEGCVYTKRRNDNILRAISPHLRDIQYELEKNEEIYKTRRALVKDLDDGKTSKLHKYMSIVRMSFENLIEKLSTNNGTLDTVNLCSYALRQINITSLNRIAIVRYEILNRYGAGSGFLSAIGTHFAKSTGSFCSTEFIPIDYLYSLYSELLSAEMKAYITTIFSYRYLDKYNEIDGCTYNPQRTVEEQIGELQANFQQKIIEYTEKFLPIMGSVFSTRTQCNPHSLDRDSTFVELEGAMQNVVMPKPYSNTLCSEIDTIGVARDQYCSQYLRCRYIPRPCLGRIYDCIDTSKDLYICMDNASSSRRYKWILDDQLSAAGTCSEEDYLQISAGPRAGCICKCMDNQPGSESTHIVNLQNVEADVKENKVVTGLRILIDHRVLHLQIQQGKLGKNWRVEDVAWKEIDDISEEIYAHRINKSISDQIPNLVENVDYRIITENEAFNVDELRVPHNHILTGVKFHYGTDQHLQIAILSRRFDPATGEINIADEPNIVRVPEDPRVIWPTRFRSFDEPRTMVEFTAFHGTLHLKFSESDWITDSGQTTTPLFDARALISSPPTPLGGFGLVYKEASISGAAFFTPKLYSLDYQTYMEESLKRLKNK